MKIFSEIVISGFDRTEFQVNQDTCNSSQTIVPTIAPAVVGDRRISLGPGVGCAGLATQLELGYRQACLAASGPELPIEVAGPATHNSNGECW
ncbi:DDB1- and CUL4-associated factor homolog 1-like [Magnolia sinica]|uniref:DDB1- and CUL4-associated factor homolog 1-like n=1 Tax=Magnolia sinica TaxID=86752 RepID=UPI002658739D|nr:DDB1- and CUL4-associated factor homolog 1-like [Magnolia sinica]